MSRAGRFPAHCRVPAGPRPGPAQRRPQNPHWLSAGPRGWPHDVLPGQTAEQDSGSHGVPSGPRSDGPGPAGSSGRWLLLTAVWGHRAPTTKAPPRSPLQGQSRRLQRGRRSGDGPANTRGRAAVGAECGAPLLCVSPVGAQLHPPPAQESQNRYHLKNIAESRISTMPRKQSQYLNV